MANSSLNLATLVLLAWVASVPACAQRTPSNSSAVEAAGTPASGTKAAETQATEKQQPAAPPTQKPAPAPPTAAPQASATTVVQLRDLAAQPEKYLKRTISVTGTLANQGTNYFTDVRIVLKDDQGHSIPVRPWLPTSLPPSPPGRPTGGEKQPAVMSDFLDKKVELVAMVQKGELRRVGNVYFLEVTSARVIS